MKFSSNLEMSSMRALGSLPSKVSGFADSGGRGARLWVAVVEGGTGTVSKGSTETQEVVGQDRVVLQDRVVPQAVLQEVLPGGPPGCLP